MAIPFNDLLLFRKKPVEWMISINSSSSAPAILRGDENRLNRPGVTMFTRTSVHWALRIVATTS